MKRKKRQGVSDAKKIIRAVKSEEKKIFKIWTVETLTAVLAVIGFLTIFLNTWQQIDIVPQIQEHSTQVDEFQKSRLAAFENIREKWTEMRVNFAPYIVECGKKDKISETDLEKYRKENRKYVDENKNAAAGILDYYWGNSIHKIFTSELNLYNNYLLSCSTALTPNLNIILRNREDKLMQLMLTKAYDPREEDKYYNNPFFANY